MQLRGSRLFNDLFPEHLPTPRQRKGRSADLHIKRNEAIADRYYFYGTILNLRYEIVMKMLADDFFISVYTIPEIITKQLAHIQRLKKEHIPVKELAKKWPRFSWSIA